jgi:hypothetical protein
MIEVIIIGEESREIFVGNRVRQGVGPALALIPGIGGALSALWTDYDVTRRLSRVQQTIDELQTHLLRRALDPEKLTVDDMALFEMTLQRVHLAWAEEKQARFARSLASSWTNQRTLPFEERVLFIQAVAELHNEHIRILEIVATERLDGFVTYSELRDRLKLEAMSNTEKGSIIVPAIDLLASIWLRTPRLGA